MRRALALVLWCGVLAAQEKPFSVTVPKWPIGPMLSYSNDNSWRLYDRGGAVLAKRDKTGIRLYGDPVRVMEVMVELIIAKQKQAMKSSLEEEEKLEARQCPWLGVNACGFTGGLFIPPVKQSSSPTSVRAAH